VVLRHQGDYNSAIHGDVEVVMGKFFRDISRLVRAPINKRSALQKLARFHAATRTLDEIVDNGMNLSTSGLFRVNSVQKKSEILSLVQRVAALKPANILEIGTCNGGTLFMWSNLASKKVVSCDLFKNHIRGELYDHFPPPHSGCTVKALSGDSHSPDFKHQVYQEFAGAKVDFLFIDGDHSEQGVKADFHDYKGLVRKGGIIAFHDILKNQPVPGNQVYYFWEAIKTQYRHEAFIDDVNQCGFGIGILHV
jgi:predicted O-methyltransferase YrrM